LSGPPYPHPNPAPGSNAIGSFEIGVSPLGDITAFDWWTTVLNQYANSPALTGTIQGFAEAVDLTHTFDDFFDLIWSVETAVGIGLDIWGRIVGVTRIVQVPSDQKYFGFEEATVLSADPWGQSPFFSGPPITDNFTLSDAAFRILIFAKILANICDGSIPAMNQLLLTLFPNRGNCYVVDGGNMTIEFAFNFVLTPVELAILGQLGVLPKPVGVSATVVEV